MSKSTIPLDCITASDILDLLFREVLRSELDGYELAKRIEVSCQPHGCQFVEFTCEDSYRATKRLAYENKRISQELFKLSTTIARSCDKQCNITYGKYGCRNAAKAVERLACQLDELYTKFCNLAHDIKESCNKPEDSCEITCMEAALAIRCLVEKSSEIRIKGFRIAREIRVSCECKCRKY